MDKILKAEVFIHFDGQLRGAHLILDYTPISKSFQVLKCVIKAKDPRLHRISAVAPGFLIIGPVPEGTLATILILEGTLATTPIPEGIPRVATPLQHAAEEATSSQPTVKEEEEEEDRGVVELTDSEDEFVVFD